MSNDGAEGGGGDLFGNPAEARQSGNLREHIEECIGYRREVLRRIDRAEAAQKAGMAALEAKFVAQMTAFERKLLMTLISFLLLVVGYLGSTVWHSLLAGSKMVP